MLFCLYSPPPPFHLQDLYQFIAKDISPPFVLSLPHPHTVLSLPDMATQPANIYHNHVVIVETLGYEGQDCIALNVFDDFSSDFPPHTVECNDKSLFDEGQSKT